MGETAARLSAQTNSPSVAALEILREHFPGAIQDGVLDAQRLSEITGIPYSAPKDAKERYGLMWADKSEAVKALQTPSMASLEPDGNLGLWDNSENIFIEGDNLEVLKLLQKSYNDQVKLIYIDPPYNTGNDFVYNDDFNDPKQRYLEVTGQVDAEGNRLVANSETTGRKHSNWLNMMYPRLVLARNLLAPNGAICVSIDDNEVHQLKILMDEIFGTENFICTLAWQSRPSMQNDTDISVNHEYVICYARNRRQTNRRLKNSNKDGWYTDPTLAVYPAPTSESRYLLDDGDGRGKYKEDPFDAPNLRPNLTYEITNPNTGEKHLPPVGRHWRTGLNEFEALAIDNRISWGSNGTGKPKLKSYLNEKAEFGEVPGTWLTAEQVGSATQGTQELQKLFDGLSPFDTAKPTKLIRKLLDLFTLEGDLVLDFFAGSGTTGHAVLQANADSKIPRRFILVNIDEPIQKQSGESEYSRVSDITKARLERVLETNTQVTQGGLRLFKLGPSAFLDTTPELEDGMVKLHLDTLREDATDDAIATEVFLKSGVRLDERWERLTICGSPVIVAGGVAVVLARAIETALVESMLTQGAHTVVFLEDAFGGRDAEKANAHFAFKQANITMKTF